MTNYEGAMSNYELRITGGQCRMSNDGVQCRMTDYGRGAMTNFGRSVQINVSGI